MRWPWQQAQDRVRSAEAAAERERRRYEEQSEAAAALLRRQQAERDQREQQRTGFLAAAAHDLRQPLTAVSLYADMLGQRLDGAGLAPDDVAHRYLRVLRAELKSLANAFDAILDFSQLESGRVRADVQPCRLADVVADLERRFAPVAAERGIVLQFGRVPAGLVVRTDRELLARVLSNLVANAVKASRPPLDLHLGGWDVRVQVRRRGLMACVCVMDRGPGIAPEMREKIFDAGFQVGNPERDRQAGFGLGLATVRGIVRHVLRDHNVRLASIVGRGTHFMVDVPLDFSAAELPAEPFPTSIIELRGKVLAGAMVMVVEDDAGVREGLAEVIKGAGAFVLQAGGLEAARARLKEADRLPDLLLTDWRLPLHATGGDVIAAVRAACGARDVPAVVITADDHAAEAALAGVPLVEVLRKPVRRKALLTRLAAHWRVEPSPLG